MKENIVTTDRLIAFWGELRCCKHYIFAMLKDAEPTDFYICGRSSMGGDAIADNMTLAQFLARSRNFKPDDVFAVYFDIRSKYEREYIDPDKVNLIALDGVDDFSVEEFDRLFEAYVRYLCEKCARKGDLLRMSSELVMRCDLTSEDAEIVAPMVERYNERAVDILRKEYDALKDLPFINRCSDSRAEM